MHGKTEAIRDFFGINIFLSQSARRLRFVNEITPARNRRGRPPKYGRPAQLVTLTLPNDVLDWLKTLHADPAWAIVKLHEQASRRRRSVELAELVRLPEGRALILVNARALSHIPGVAIIPMSDGRGLLALEAGHGVADLELAVIDRLDAPRLSATEREALMALRDKLREWRQQGVGFESRSIIVATRGHLQQTGRTARLPPAARANGSRDVA